VATKLFLGEYWTGATGDFQNVRARLWQLAHYGYFGPPLDMQQGAGMVKEKTEVVEKFWRKLEQQTEQILAKHAPEVHAVAQALLERNDLTGKQCIEIIHAAATSSEAVDSEFLLKTLVEETIVNGKNGKSETKPKSRRKTMSRAKAKAK
ncbi:MAG TPA: hypothetical protein VI753_07130, partial [Anaerolineales bacterium]|nr:hypothetical protein [Anaerolineales bacterium]